MQLNNHLRYPDRHTKGKPCEHHHCALRCIAQQPRVRQILALVSPAEKSPSTTMKARICDAAAIFHRSPFTSAEIVSPPPLSPWGVYSLSAHCLHHLQSSQHTQPVW
ncbi:hypothetical protein Vafri_3986, partial [Volvox africanus]